MNVLLPVGRDMKVTVASFVRHEAILTFLTKESLSYEYETNQRTNRNAHRVSQTSL